MSKTKSYDSAPRGISKEIEGSIPVKDFLPSPEVIATMIKKEETTPVTMKLKKKTLEQYKKYAHKMGIKYQTFVSALLDNYAQRL